MTDIAFRSATELMMAIRSKEIGSLELLDHYLDRVERLNPSINAVVTLDIERARQEARAADQEAARGEWRGALHGLPMTVKDALETAGMRTTSGAPELADHVPAQDADVVARLRVAGAVIFGKTNLPIYASDLQTYNDMFGTTNNPWNAERVPGGSSGGAAAALAAGLTGLELGSDIGGSIRNPAHYCGVYGHKPTHGIISIRGHIPGPPGTLAPPDIGVVGPMGRAADDLDLGLDVLAGPDAARSVAWRLELPKPRRRSLREYRVAVWLDDPACPVDAAVRERLEAAVTALRGVGVLVDEQARPAFSLADGHRVFLQLLWGVTASGLPEEAFNRLIELAARLPPEDDSSLARYARFTTQRKRDWNVANEARERMRQHWARFFKDYDVLLCPAMQTTAFPHDHNSNPLARTILVNGEPRPSFEGMAWAGFVGMCFLPATVAPVGRAADGLPVGIQIVGPYLEDRTTIDFARRMAEVVGGFELPPGYEMSPEETP